MSLGYGILAETTALAGRDIEDCCSPEFHYAVEKVNIDGTNLIEKLKPGK